VADKVPPAVSARRSSGRAGTVVQLRFSVSDDRGEARVVDQVKRGGRVIATVSTGFRKAGGATSVSWRAPSAAEHSLTHCVRAWDRAGNASATSCAPLVLR
jgi:hypothetical protein